MAEGCAQKRAYCVWDGSTILGRVFRGPGGAIACDTALEPFACAVLAEAAPGNATFSEAPSRLAFAVAKRVGPQVFAYPEGIDPSGPIDTQDTDAMAAASVRASREAGGPVLVFDADSTWRRGRKRLREQRAKAALEEKGEGCEYP